MSYIWPKGTRFREVSLKVGDRCCQFCAGPTYVKDHKERKVATLDAPLKLVSEMTLCTVAECPGHHELFVAEGEAMIAPPWWILGWDVFAHLGQRRFARSWSVPEICEDLRETYGIVVSVDCVEDYVGRYQSIVAARQSDPELLKASYRKIPGLILSIDGLQPEKGHETLYTVRELNAKRVWFAETLISSSAEEIGRLLLRAKTMAEDLGKPIRAWVSDKQDAFVQGIRDLFPGTAHRYCQNHFLRDVAQPVLEIDSQAKVKMRKKVRGLRTIERQVIEEQRSQSPVPQGEDTPEDVVLDYCSTVRGILNQNQGGPLEPPGVRMVDSLTEVRESIQRGLDAGTGGTATNKLERLVSCIDRGINAVGKTPSKVRVYVLELKDIYGTLDPSTGDSAAREAKFREMLEKVRSSSDPIRLQMAAVMESWEPGLFAGEDKLDFLRDNLDLERWFRLPKSYQRRINGHKHTGTTIVEEGPSLVLALDAHAGHRRPFEIEELQPYLGAKPAPSELAAVERRKIMRRARSRKQRSALLKELEQRLDSAISHYSATAILHQNTTP